MVQQKTGETSVLTSSPQAGGVTVTPPRPAGMRQPRATGTVKITHEQIARRAHEIWVQQGCRPGRDKEHWFEAERQLKAELAVK